MAPSYNKNGRASSSTLRGTHHKTAPLLQSSSSSSSSSGRTAKGGSDRTCTILATMWLVMVLIFSHFCMLELKALHAQQDRLRTEVRDKLQDKLGMMQEQREDDGMYAKNSSSAMVGNATTTPTTNSEREGKNASSLLALLAGSASDGVSMIGQAVATGLTDTLHVAGGSVAATSSKDLFDDPFLGQQQQSAVSTTTTEDPRESNSGKKGHLILHVGPSKTATTTLQTDLTQAHDEGWLAPYEYSGRYYRPFSDDNGVLKLNRSESPLLVAARDMLHPLSDKSICCDDFVRELDTLYNSKQLEYEQEQVRNGTETIDPFFLRVILSDEAFGNLWLNETDYRRIHDAVHQEYRVTIVVGYRRFYEWILSNKYQRDRTDRISQMGKELWPPEGRALLPMFPDTMSTYRKWFHYTDAILQAINGTFAHRLLNLHSTTTTTTMTSSSQSILTQLLCDVLNGNDESTSLAAPACVHSRSRDATTQTRLNMQSDQTFPSLFYDRIATEAAAAGLVDESVVSRKDVREAVREYHEDNQGLTPNDLPLTCPTETELQALYEKSIAMEETHVVPAMDNAAVSHLEGFTESVQAQKYCWVDASAVLGQTNWIEFFKEYGSGVPTTAATEK